MDAETEKSPECPVGESACNWLEELARVHQRVDELAELVSHDTLTGLFNYRHFSELLPMVLERTRRSLRPSSLIIIDLDRFKIINDTFGHAAGDSILCTIAARLRESLRDSDTIVAGHMPFVSRAVSVALGLSPDQPIVAFKPGGLAVLERDAEGAWQLVLFVRPDQV